MLQTNFIFISDGVFLQQFYTGHTHTQISRVCLYHRRAACVAKKMAFFTCNRRMFPFVCAIFSFKCDYWIAVVGFAFTALVPCVLLAIPADEQNGRHKRISQFGEPALRKVCDFPCKIVAAAQPKHGAFEETLKAFQSEIDEAENYFFMCEIFGFGKLFCVDLEFLLSLSRLAGWLGHPKGQERSREKFVCSPSLCVERTECILRSLPQKQHRAKMTRFFGRRWLFVCHSFQHEIICCK